MLGVESGQAAPQFHIGALVVGSNGEVGTIRRVVMDPETRSVVDLVVALSADGGREVVLPADRVLQTDAEATRVDMDSAEMRRLPDFEEVRFRSPEEGWRGLPEYTPDVVLYWAPRTAVEALMPPSIVPEPNVEGVRNVPPGSAIVEVDLDVLCGQQVVGHVHHVLTDAEGDHATHLVIDRGWLDLDERLVPVDDVRRITDTAVELECEPGGIDSYPRYRE